MDILTNGSNEPINITQHKLKTNNMKVTTKKQSVVEDGKEVRAMYYMIIDNEQGQTLTVNVGEKTHNAVNKMNELTIKTKANEKKV